MKILWITNIMMPDVCLELKRPVSVFGGWMSSSANYLAQSDNIELGIATVYDGTSIWSRVINGIQYYLLPLNGGSKSYYEELEPLWPVIKHDFNPDIIHIHGSEYPYGLAYVNACGSQGVVLSIQGMTSVYAQYYYGGLSFKDILFNITLSDLYFKRSIFRGKIDFKTRGEIEKELIKKIDHVIGRTSWDKLHVSFLNPEIKYHFCNETLRPSFYSGKWCYSNCLHHSIFVPQAWYPIKGLHQVLKALPTIKERYPDVQIRIAGENITKHSSIKDRLLMSGYGRIIERIIKMNRLEDCVQFTGLLDENQMKEEYLRANVFICPSAIENSPNSLGEAQMLGTPCIAAYVGGVSDMVTHGETGFIYRFEDVEMLTEYVCKVFALGDRLNDLSEKEQACSLLRHDGIKNVKQLRSIYNDIFNEK